MRTGSPPTASLSEGPRARPHPPPIPAGRPWAKGSQRRLRAGGRAGVPWAVSAEPPMSSQLHGCPCELRDWQSPAESGQAARRGASPSPLPLPLASTCPAAAGPSAPGWDPTCLMQWEGSSRPTAPPGRPVFGLAFQTVGRRAEGFLPVSVRPQTLRVRKSLSDPGSRTAVPPPARPQHETPHAAASPGSSPLLAWRQCFPLSLWPQTQPDEDNFLAQLLKQEWVSHLSHQHGLRYCKAPGLVGGPESRASPSLSQRAPRGASETWRPWRLPWHGGPQGLGTWRENQKPPQGRRLFPSALGGVPKPHCAEGRHLRWIHPAR